MKNSSSSDLWQIDYEVLRSNPSRSPGRRRTTCGWITIESGVADRRGRSDADSSWGFHQTLGVAVGYRGTTLARNENRIEIQPPGGGPGSWSTSRIPQP
mgnify:CR=1 FL=1